MSVQERREEAEAVLDSAEMMLETYPGAGEKSRKLEGKIKELEQELQEPESESRLRELIDDIRELMEQMKDEPIEPDMGHEEDMGGGMGPGDDMPPI